MDTGGYYPAKGLAKVRRLGWSLKRVLIIDDEPIKLRKNYGNAIYVSPFEGAKEDNELELLAATKPASVPTWPQTCANLHGN